MNTTHARGFTLVEMVVVVAIVAVLATAARPMVELAARRAKESELRQALRSVRNAIDGYKQAVDEGRIERAADASGYPPTLRALVDGVADRRMPDGSKRLYFLRRLPRDPFADPALAAEQTWALRSHDSPPETPRPGRDVFDIASRSPRVALDGSRYDEW